MSVLPGDNHGALEWLPGTVDLLEHSSLLDCLACAYIVSVCLESACGMMVTWERLGASLLQFTGFSLLLISMIFILKEL